MRRMSRNGNCPHLEILQLSLSELYTVKQGYPCAQCDARGRNLWICLYRTCMHIGCSEHDNDHGTKHFCSQPAHCLQLNLSTRRIWCYLCNHEVLVPDGHDQGDNNNSSSSSQSRRFGAYDQQYQAGGGRRRLRDDIDNSSDDEQRQRRPPADSDDDDDGGGDEGAADAADALDTSGLIGLKNIANTCYMNAALQALSNTPALHGYFIDCGDIVEATVELQAQQQQQHHQHQPQLQLVQQQRRAGLARSYHRLVKDMWSRNRRSSVASGAGYVIPTGILNGIRSVHPMFRGYQQHDTQEFLRCFMDQLHDELKESAPAAPAVYLQSPPLGLFASTGDSVDDNRSQCPSPTQSLSEAEYETCDSGVSEQSSLSEEPVDEQQLGKGRAPSERSSPALSMRRYAVPAGPRASSPTASGYYSGASNTYQRQAHQHTQNKVAATAVTATAAGATSSSAETHSTASAADAKPKSPPLQQRSIISDVFDGKLLSSVQCLTCDRISASEETFQDLSLPIPGKDNLSGLHHAPQSPVGSQQAQQQQQQPPKHPLSAASSASLSSCGSTASTAPSTTGSIGSFAQLAAQLGWIWWLWNWVRSFFCSPSVSLYDCMAAFFSADELKGDNMYSCERCRKLRNGIKYSRVLQLPEMLCVHLKRFRHDVSYSTKIAAAVRFPLRGLDMSGYLHRDCRSRISTYDLTAVICHHGTVGGGHYTSYALHPRTGRWYEYDDQLVTAVSEETVAACEAYVLFYRKSNAHMRELRQQAMDLLDVCEVPEPPASSAATVPLTTTTATTVLPNPDLRFFVSKQWLNKFNTFAEPGPIDNWALLCAHDAIAPHRTPLMGQLVVALPQPLWDFLYRRFGGGPAINYLYECDCCRRTAQQMRDRQLAEVVAFQRHKDAPQTTLYAISMDWLRKWQAFVAGVDGCWSPDGDCQPPGPIANAAIAGQQQNSAAATVLRSVRAGSDYAQVNAQLWNFFHGTYGGGPTIVLRGSPDADGSARMETAATTAAADVPVTENSVDEDERRASAEVEANASADEDDAVVEAANRTVNAATASAIAENPVPPTEPKHARLRGTKITKNVSFEDETPAQAEPIAPETQQSVAADNESMSSVTSATGTAKVGNDELATARDSVLLEQERQKHSYLTKRHAKDHRQSDIVSKRDKHRHRVGGGGITANGMFGVEGKYSFTPSADQLQANPSTPAQDHPAFSVPSPPSSDYSGSVDSHDQHVQCNGYPSANGASSQLANADSDNDEMDENSTTTTTNTAATATVTITQNVPMTKSERKAAGKATRRKQRTGNKGLSRHKSQQQSHQYQMSQSASIGQ